MSEPSHIFHDNAAKRFKTCFRRHVGQGREYSVDGISEDTGINERTIRSYRDSATPGLGHLLLLFQHMPLEFTNSILSFVGIVAKKIRPDEETGPQYMIHATAVVHRLAEMLGDGRIDHQERPVLIAMLRALQTHTQALIDKLEKEEPNE